MSVGSVQCPVISKSNFFISLYGLSLPCLSFQVEALLAKLLPLSVLKVMNAYEGTVQSSSKSLFLEISSLIF
jgi:hypothetical protein